MENKLLVADPRNVDAMYLNGRGLATRGKWAEAAVEFRRVLTLRPDFLPGMIDLGLALALAGEVRDAYSLLERARARDPQSAELHFGLGLCLMHGGDLANAAAAFLAALARNPRFPDAYNNLGVVYDRLGELPKAVDCFRQAVAIRPAFATALLNLGDALLRLGQAAAAADALQKAAVVRPRDALLQADLGAARLAAHDFPAAVAALERALSLDPGLVHAACNLGEALLHLNAMDRAAAAFHRALEILSASSAGKADLADARGRISQRLADTLLNHGRTLESLGRHPEAIAALERALAIRPAHPETVASLASCAFRTCAWNLLDKAMAELRSVPLGLDSLHPFLLLAAGVSPAEQSQSLQRRGRLSQPAGEARITSRRARDRLRVAYVSPDFREHPVAHALAGVIEGHDRQMMAPIGISLAASDTSEIGRRLRSSFDEMIDASGMSDLEVATLLQQREIDVAIDLAGHTLGGRPGIFAHRAAPVQVNYLGFPASTGFNFMDYIIADEVVLPPSDEHLYTERVLRLPNCYLPFDSNKPHALHIPSREEAGLPPQAFVFCAFNNAYKITREIFCRWTSILLEVPGSVLWLRSMGETAAANLRTAAAAVGIAPERLIFAPQLPSVHANIARLRLAGLFLDTSPYNAHTSAAEALWAGVPVLTCLGRSFAGRVGASLLTAVGMPELICVDAEQYRTLAIDMARSPALLESLKERLTAARVSAPVFDTARYARDLEALLLSACALPRPSGSLTQ